MQHSPRMTRSRAASEAGSESRRAITTAETAEAQTLQTILEELRQLREEREQERQELADLRRRMGARETGMTGDNGERQGQYNSNLKLKPDNYDGTGSFYEFITQFELISRANVWSEQEKALVFAACLRGKARSVLEEIGENFCYLELKSKLELRFGEQMSFQNYYYQFINRKLKLGEDFAFFGGELERLVRLAYPECNFGVRDRIACAQFITGLPGGLVKQTLQLEGVISLQKAVERAKAVSLISGRGEFLQEERFKKINNFRQKGNEELEQNSRWNTQSNQRKMRGTQRFNENNGKEKEKEWGGECWQCGKRGHYRAECPALLDHRPK